MRGIQVKQVLWKPPASFLNSQSGKTLGCFWKRRRKLGKCVTYSGFMAERPGNRQIHVSHRLYGSPRGRVLYCVSMKSTLRGMSFDRGWLNSWFNATAKLSVQHSTKANVCASYICICQQQKHKSCCVEVLAHLGADSIKSLMKNTGTRKQNTYTMNTWSNQCIYSALKYIAEASAANRSKNPHQRWAQGDWEAARPRGFRTFLLNLWSENDDIRK